MTKYCLVSWAAVFILWASPALAAENLLVIDLGQGVKLELVLVKKGQFDQGSPRNEAGRNDDETLRRVAITKDFFLGKYPVTVAQFRRFAEETGYRTEAEQGVSGGFGFDGKALVQRKEFNWRRPGYPQSDDRPVTIVTYDDALAFAGWLAGKAARKISLPTEAQWEYACRAGTTSRFYSGDSETDLQAIGWYRVNSAKSAQPVGQKRPNAFGLYDMSGNVYEWCRDWYGPYGADASDPEETRSDRTTPPRRVLRGGSWLKDARQCRSAARFRNTPASRNADNGFRVAAEVAFLVERPEADVIPLRWPQSAPEQMRADLSPLIFLAILAAVIVLIFRAFQRVGAGGGPLQQGPALDRPRTPSWISTGLPAGMGLRHQTTADGFWIDTRGLARGSVIHYTYESYGAPQHGKVMVEPGDRQFVYTGQAPGQVNITQVIPADDSVPLPVDTTFGSSSSQGDFSSDTASPSSEPPVSSSGSSFTGFPSAY